MNNTTERVLLITPSIHMGGMQNAMVNLANGFAIAGLKVEMYALFKLEHFFKLDNRVQFSESPKPPECYNVMTRMISILTNVRKVIKKSDSQTVIVYGKFYSALTLLASLGLKKRIFISDRVSPLYKDPLYVELITSMIYFFIMPAGIIAQTNISATCQRQRFRNDLPIEVIPNPVREINHYDYEKEKKVLAVGRFGDYLKGFDRLIEAWGKVDAPDWKLVFAGGFESDDPALGKRAKALKVYDTIVFSGKVNNIDELYARSSIFVIPSRSEGFPNALAEAMSAGLACVSFDFIAGPRDMIRDGYNGYLVTSGDIDALANKIQYLIEHEAERKTVSHNATEIKDVLSLERIIQQHINFIFV